MALTDNIHTYWKFDESSGNASDSVGSNTATNVNTTPFATAKINNGINLNGSWQYFTFNTCPQTGNGSFSISAWAKADTLGSANSIVNFGTALTNQAIVFDFRSSKLYADFYAATTVTGATTLSTGTWYFCVLTFDGTNIRLYLNGSLDATSANTSGNIVDGSGAIGRAFWAAGNYFDGLIDEVGLWSRVLTPTEITELYNSGSGFQYPFGIAYTLALSVGTFTLTGIAALFRIALKLIATVQTYALTGLDTTLRLGKGFIAEVATFTLTGISALFRTSAWRNSESKPSSTYTNSSKSSSTWTNRGKNQ